MFGTFALWSPLCCLSFPEFREALTLHMVETSGDLKELQMKALGATPAPGSSSAVYRGDTNGGGGSMQLPGGGEIFWHSKLEEVRAGQSRQRPSMSFLDRLMYALCTRTETTFGSHATLTFVILERARCSMRRGREGRIHTNR